MAELNFKEILAEEVEEQELTKPQINMLHQKFGIIEPQLTNSENNLIEKELRVYGRQD